jgi:glycogen debranching enzyme
MHVFPLLMLLGNGVPAEASRRLADLNASIPSLFAATESYYAHFFDRRIVAHTPNPEFDRALAWAQIVIDQGFVAFHDETGLTAGYYASGDSARPGYAWFFGRDALWTSYALNSTGAFDRTRQALEFLIRRQRADGKIMHEFSQTADMVDWKATPYFYAAADSTPLFVMAMRDYVAVSRDVAFLQRHREAVKRAWEFTRAHDSDGDGIYENTEGTGWVESWPPGMPHQEIYLAALDQQSCDAMSELAASMKDTALASHAAAQARHIEDRIAAEYWDTANSFYAFSRNADGSLDRTATIYPAVAWWTGRLALPHAGPMLSRWASSEFSTDWGTRDISPATLFYDPISYHQGSVWPLFTGWVSLAEYRAGRPLSGYAHLMQNAGLTWSQDLGGVTELLSGEFFQPLGRSSSRQIWSSAMVLTPALRGLFGLDWDIAGKLSIHPHLPASWDTARLENVPVGSERISIDFTRTSDGVRVHPSGAGLTDFTIPSPLLEIELPAELPLPGATTSQLKATGESCTEHACEIELEAPAGSSYDLSFRAHPGVRIEGGAIRGSKLHIEFPAGVGYQKVHVSGSVGTETPR